MRLLPGGFCSLLLADFGADVIKVEDTGMGDYVRWSPPFHEGAEDTAKGALFLALNRNKRSVRIDLKNERGREVLLALAKDADVLLPKALRSYCAIMLHHLTRLDRYHPDLASRLPALCRQALSRLPAEPLRAVRAGMEPMRDARLSQLLAAA